MGVRSGGRFKRWGGWAVTRLREFIFKRDGLICRWCRCELVRHFPDVLIQTENTATIDHIRPRGKGGSDHPTNLCVACNWCNQKRGRELDRELQSKAA